MLTHPSFSGPQGLTGRTERVLSEGLERLPDSWDVTRVASGSGDARPCINISPTPPVRLRKRQIEWVRVCALCCADVRGRMSPSVRGTRSKSARGKQRGNVRQQRGGEGRGY